MYFCVYNGPKGLNYVADCVSGTTGSSLIDCLAYGGSYVIYSHLSEEFKISSLDLMWKKLNLRAFLVVMESFDPKDGMDSLKKNTSIIFDY